MKMTIATILHAIEFVKMCQTLLTEREFSPVLNEGLAYMMSISMSSWVITSEILTIQTLSHARILILNPSQAIATKSPAHSHPGLRSNHQNIDIEVKQTKAE